MSLNNIRNEIDAIDRSLITLLKQRMDISKAVAVYKYINGIDVANREREEEILDNICKSGIGYIKEIKSIYESIFRDSRKIQEDFIEKIKNFRSKDSIILIGMPGAGKTTIGKILANVLNLRFIDLDEEYIDVYGESPAETILKNGEPFFRKQEAHILRKSIENQPAVISTGGGVVTVEENRKTLSEQKNVIWIKREIDKLDTGNRPLSANKEMLYLERKEFYRSLSDFSVENHDIYIAVSNIIDRFIDS